MCHMVNTALVIALRLYKGKRGPEVEIFRTKLLIYSISAGLYISFNWQNGIDRTRAFWLSVLLVISVLRVYCCTQKC